MLIILTPTYFKYSLEKLSLLKIWKFANMSKRKSSSNDSEVGSDLKKKKSTGHWSMGLLDSIEDPKYFVKADDLVNVIKDKYPKAKYHYLIMPKENIPSLKSITTKHTQLLKHMEDVAKEIINTKEHQDHKFKLGYHAEASMARLHLHVISDDMDSNCVKTKKHWNSFTTDFFISSKDILENLNKNGKVVLPTKDICKKYMDTPLKCHKCDFKPKHMPALKKHILIHLEK